MLIFRWGCDHKKDAYLLITKPQHTNHTINENGLFIDIIHWSFSWCPGIIDHRRHGLETTPYTTFHPCFYFRILACVIRCNYSLSNDVIKKAEKVRAVLLHITSLLLIHCLIWSCRELREPKMQPCIYILVLWSLLIDRSLKKYQVWL